MNTMPLKVFPQALGAKAFVRALMGRENFRFEPGVARFEGERLRQA